MKNRRSAPLRPRIVIRTAKKTLATSVIANSLASTEALPSCEESSETPAATSAMIVSAPPIAIAAPIQRNALWLRDAAKIVANSTTLSAYRSTVENTVDGAGAQMAVSSAYTSDATTNAVITG